MRVLLINPPFYRLMGSHYNGLHLGLAYIGAVLRQKGHTVALYNADYLPQNWYPDQKAIFSGFEDYKTAHGLAHQIWHEVEEQIREFMPEVVGITMCTGTYRSAQNVAMVAKRASPKARVIVGGPHPTLNMNVQKLYWFNSVVRGEGEYLSLSPLKQEQKVLRRPDLDKLPFPMRDSFINDTEHMDLGNIITGRGCPNQCTYCASPAIWNRKVRFRKTESVVEEVKGLQRMRVETVKFCDDTFNLSIDRTAELCKELALLGVEWVCDARVDRLTERLLHLMKIGGCQRIKVGIESGSDRILKRVKKGFTVGQARRGIELIHQAGIPLTVYLMCGFPSETDEDLEQTLELARWAEADYYSVSVFTPYFGTAVWKELEEQGRLPDKNHWELFYHQSGEMIANDKLSRKAVDRLLALNDKGGERV